MRNMPDLKNLDPSEGVANIKFSAFFREFNEQHVFKNIECFVPILVKKSDFHLDIKLFHVELDDTM